MALEMRRERVERRLHLGFIGELRCAAPSRAQPMRALRVVGEQPMHIAAARSGRRPRPRRRAAVGEAQQGCAQPGRRCGRHASRSREGARRRRPARPATRRSILSPAARSRRRAGRARRPRPAALRCPSGSLMRGPASDSRRRGRAPGRRGADGPRYRCPSRRAQGARSAIVAFEPGRMTSSASPGSGSPGRTMTQLDVAAPAAADRDRRNWRCGQHAARRSTIGRPVARRAAPASADRILGRQARPRRKERDEAERGPAGALARCSRMPSANSVGSPRNLLTRKPAIMRGVRRASSTALVPTIWAMTPPRSMSPISTTGTSARAGKAHIGDVVRRAD